MSDQIKHTHTQSFWLGATSALAIVLGILLWGVINGSVTFNDSGSVVKKAAFGDDAAPTAEAIAIAADEDISVEPVTDADYVRGDRNAAISIIEFSDIECPYCAGFHETMTEIVEKYDGQVNWVYRHFPLASHPQAEPAANAAECVGELGGNDAFWSFLDEAFANQETLGATTFTTAAANAGVNASAFETCVSEKRYVDKVTAQTAEAAAAGASGTPHSVIVSGDSETLIPIRGALPIDQVEALIEPLLQ